METNTSLWQSSPPNRHFYLLPHTAIVAPGSLAVHGPGNAVLHCDPEGLLPYEVTEQQARRWAAQQLGESVDALKAGLDDRFGDLREALAQQRRTPVLPDSGLTPDAGPALLELVKKLSGVIADSLANDAGRIESAKASMRLLQHRLKDAGIDLDERFNGFPERLAGLRDEFERRRCSSKEPPGDA